MVSKVDARAGDYLEVALSSVDEGIFLVDTSDLVIFCNPSLGKLVGLKNAQVIGQTYRLLLRHIAGLSHNAQKTEHELDLAHKGLDQRPVVYVRLRYPLEGRLQLGLFPLHDDQGRFSGWGGFVRDVTVQMKGMNRFASLDFSV